MIKKGQRSKNWLNPPWPPPSPLFSQWCPSGLHCWTSLSLRRSVSRLWKPHSPFSPSPRLPKKMKGAKQRWEEHYQIAANANEDSTWDDIWEKGMRRWQTRRRRSTTQKKKKRGRSTSNAFKGRNVFSKLIREKGNPISSYFWWKLTILPRMKFYFHWNPTPMPKWILNKGTLQKNLTFSSDKSCHWKSKSHH